MSTSEDRRAVSAYRVRRLLVTLSSDQLRDIIATERENGRAFETMAEMSREELARRGEQA
jgi:hypothetical protein